jgi:hypothetical protein
MRSPAARRLYVNYDVVLLRIEAVIDPADLGTDAGASELPQPGELIAPDDVALGLDFHKRDRAVLFQHEVRKSVAHVAEITAHGPDDRRDAFAAGAREQQTNCIAPRRACYCLQSRENRTSPSISFIGLRM